MSDLEGHLTRNGLLWERWVDYGVTDQTVLAVEFHFYATRESSARRLCELLGEAGYEVTRRATRTLLFFKGFDITATERGRWTLERLQARTRQLHELGEQVGVALEGCGAEMPERPVEP